MCTRLLVVGVVMPAVGIEVGVGGGPTAGTSGLVSPVRHGARFAPR